MNTFGNIYRLTSFGESHGPAVGGVIDGLPPGEIFSFEALQEELDRRRPGRDASVSARREPDRLILLSGFLPAGEGLIRSLGTPVGFYVANTDCLPGAYDDIRGLYRPNHADYAWERKYGLRDWRGGGRASGRETVSRVVYGAFARQILSRRGISVNAEVSAVGGSANPAEFSDVIVRARSLGDSLGGIVSATVTGVPAGLGEPTFGKLQQMLASAMLSIGGVHGFDYGDGISLASMTGSEAADGMCPGDGDAPRFLSNHCGGIQGGISNGQDIRFRVFFKPTPSVAVDLPTVDTAGNPARISTKGRHDPCIALRGAPVVKAMAAGVILDAMLLARTVSLD